MGKAHCISFPALLSANTLRVVKLTPEGAAARYALARVGRIYAFCSHHGMNG